MKIERFHGGIALAAFLAIAASAVFLVEDYQAAAERHRAVLLVRAQTTLDALTAGIRAHGRMGRYRGERLAYIFEELARTPDILSVSLRSSDGEIIAAGGNKKDEAFSLSAGPFWEPGVLRLSRTLTLQIGGRGQGMGRGHGIGLEGDPMKEGEAWVPMPPGPHIVSVTLDTQAMEAEINRDRLRSLIAFGVVFLMVLSGAVASAGWLRRRRLQNDLLVAQEQAAHQEHLTRLGAGLAHETKNPLGIVRGQAQLIVDADSMGENGARARIIVDEIDRAVGQIDGFLKLSRPQTLTLGSVELEPLVSSLGRVLADEIRQHEVDLVVGVGKRVILADAEQLRRVLLNLVLNALQASSPGGRIEIRAEGKKSITLAVRDTGAGIAPEDLARVTEPYFTRSESGCGLGLALVSQIVKTHGWTLHLDSTPGEGTTVALQGIAPAEEDFGE